MKKILPVVSMFILAMHVSSQDTLIMTSGEKHLVIVKKVGMTSVEYVRYDNQKGPQYEVSKSDVNKIVYQNGVEDIFQQSGLQAEVSLARDDSKGEFVDGRDGKTYRFVVIGEQTWMAENLKYNLGTGFNVGGNCGECCIYYSFNNALKACPEGWHLPMDKEWMDLEIYLGMDGVEAASSGWRGTAFGQAPTLLRDGKTGLDLLMCGYAYYPQDEYSNFQFSINGSVEEGYYWTGTAHSGSKAYYRLFAGRRSIKRDTISKNYMLSVRCIKD